MRRVILIISAALALVILAATPTALSMVQRTDAAPPTITERSTDPSVGPIRLPDISDDPYYRPGDMFEVTPDGSLFMVGTNNAIQSDVDWLILEHTSLPIGLYVLDDSGRMVGTY